MRCVYSETVRDSAGNIMANATVRAYIETAGTQATIYEEVDSTTSVSSVSTNSDGSFKFYVDRFDYDSDQKFQIIVTKGSSTKTYDDVTIDRVVMGTYAGDKTLTTTLRVPEGVIYSGTITVSTGTIIAGLYQIFSGTVTGLTKAYPEWWGAKRDGSTNDASAIDAATNAISGGGEVIFSAGTYMIQTAISVANSGTRGITWKGAGQHATILLTPATGSTGALTTGALITWTCTGYSTTISDMTITADTGGNTNIDGLLITGSNGVNVDKMWFSSFHEGLKIAADSSNIRVSRIESEYNTMGVTVSASDMCTFSDIHTYRNSSCGIYNTGTPTLAIAGTAQGNTFFNLSLFEDGYGGDGSGASFYNNSTTPYAIDNVTAGSYGDTPFPYTGIYNNTGHTFGTINNPLIMMASRRGIYHLAGNLYVNGGKIDKAGYYDQSTPWATNGIYAGSGATSLKVRGTWINSEGNGIHTQAVWTELDGLTLYDCSSGGSTGSVNETTGVYSVLFDPQTTEHRFRLSNSHFYTSGGTGKTALRFNATATPANAGDVKLANNSVSYDTTDFDARFSTAIANASMLIYDYVNNTSLLLTENSGTSTIANTGTSVEVIHGLGLTPLAQHIYVIGTENPTNAVGTIWLSDLGATTFQVNVENDPGASGWDFSWRASIR